MMLTEQEIIEFFDKQLRDWPAVSRRFADLENCVRTRSFANGDVRLDVQFNPQRIRSTKANISEAAVRERPCFLCDINRPTEQRDLPVGERYHVLVNPYPILPHHLTLPTFAHVPQQLSALTDLLKDCVARMPHFLFFYNGAHCGASAPDHAHLQAVARGFLPIERDWTTYAATLEPIVPDSDTSLPQGNRTLQDGIYALTAFACPAFVVLGNRENTWPRLSLLLSNMPAAASGSEPELNLLAWSDPATPEPHIVVVVFPRSKHRPDCYYASGATQMLVSPGALDMGGLIITPREEDFRQMTFEKARAILAEVAATPEVFQQTCDKLRSCAALSAVKGNL